MNKDLLKQYADLKVLIADAESKLDTLKPQVLETIGEAEEVQTDFGTFSITKRRSWTYPQDITNKEKELKADQKKAQQLGTAEYTEAPVLVFKVIKENENAT